MKKLLLVIATALPLFCNGQHPYVAFALGYMPVKDSPGFLSLELTAGTHIGKYWCIEYNQNISLTPKSEVPKYIQLRTGPEFKLNRDLYLRTVAGYSITSVPANADRRIGHGVTAAAYLVQTINRELQMKYELSINNGLHIVPSIGLCVSF